MLANYEKTEKLCGEAIRQHPAAPDLWIVRNRRIIALLGMWTLAGEPKHLESAAAEARASLATKLPTGADIVPQFCLAKEALRQGDLEPESVILDLIEKTGGAEAPCSAHAAAVILALNANSRDLHDRYSAKLLAAPNGDNPVLWPMVSFLRDRVYTYRLLKANYIHKERDSARYYMINHGAPPMTGLLPTVKLKTLDGRTLSLPKDTNGKLTLLVFVEPSAEPDAEFPIAVGEGEDKKPHHHYIQFACDLADRHVNKGVTTIDGLFVRRCGTHQCPDENKGTELPSRHRAGRPREPDGAPAGRTFGGSYPERFPAPPGRLHGVARIGTALRR